MDGKLNSRQSDLTFQMKVLCYKNHEFMRRYEGTLKDKWMEEAEAKTKALLKNHISSKKEEDIDSDMDDLMDAYNIEDVGTENAQLTTTNYTRELLLFQLVISSCYFEDYLVLAEAWLIWLELSGYQVITDN